MPKVSNTVLAAIKEALVQWEQEVKSADLAPAAEKTYLLHPRHFVRWLEDDFEPGARKRPK